MVSIKSPKPSGNPFSEDAAPRNNCAAVLGTAFQTSSVDRVTQKADRIPFFNMSVFRLLARLQNKSVNSELKEGRLSPFKARKWKVAESQGADTAGCLVHPLKTFPFPIFLSCFKTAPLD